MTFEKPCSPPTQGNRELHNSIGCRLEIPLECVKNRRLWTTSMHMGPIFKHHSWLTGNDQCENLRCAIALTTNGSVLTDTICATLAEIPETRITFSIDGATAESFQSIRVGGNLDTVAKNIRRLAETRASADGPYLAIWIVVTHENVMELPGIIGLAASLGVNKITLQPLFSDWGKANIKAINQSKRVELDSPRLQRQFAKAQQVAAELGIPLTVYRTEKLSRRNKCSWPWHSAYIDSKGDVVPCCIIADAETVKMRTVFEASF